jgi:glycosyltransferase involved in cell wall biosynthesis
MIVFGSPINGGARQAPAVSVVMAVYNAQDFLAEAIESVLDQTLADFELLVVDDASTDGSPAIVERYARADRRIRAFRLARNGGTAHARNAALAHARAPFVAICDDDDRQLPERLATQVRYLEAHPRHVMVGCKIRPFGDVDGAPLAWLPGGDALARPHVLFQALYIDSASLFRRDLACVHGLRYPAGPVWEDWVFQALALRVGEIHVLPEILLDYRRHAAQQTSPARLMASGRRTRATMLRVLEIAGVTCSGMELELHHAISPSPFGLVPDRDFLLRHRDTLEAEAEAWLGRLGRQAVLAG